MLNLNRLKSTGLLMKGFDECLTSWLSPDQANPNPLQVVPERLEVFSKLSGPIRRYYEIVNRWIWPKPGEHGPLAYRSTNCLLFPYYAEERTPDYDSKIRYDLAECLYQIHGDWSAAVNFEDLPTIYFENINDEPLVWKSSSFCYDEFLVMVAFHELLTWSDDHATPSTTPRSDDLIFNGPYWTTNFNIFYTSADNRLWLFSEKSDDPIASATRTRNLWGAADR